MVRHIGIVAALAAGACAITPKYATLYTNDCDEC
jgi:hypothetical protein